jgi:hypothetical protein
MTTRVVGDVAVRVGADVGPLKIGLQDAGRNVDRFGRRGRNMGQALRRGAGIAATAITALAGSIAAAASRSIASMDSIGKKADQIGLAVEAFQELRFAAESAGVSNTAFTSSMERFSKRLGEAAQGTGAAVRALDEMNLSATALAELGVEGAFEVIADQIAAIEDPTQRAAQAAALFGREGVAMVNMLRQGSDAIRTTREEARAMGAVIGEDVVRDAEALEDELGRLKAVISAQFSEALIEAGPLLIEFAEGIANIARAVNNAVSQISDFVSGIVELFRTSEEELAAFEERASRRGSIRRGANSGGDGGDAVMPGEAVGGWWESFTGGGHEGRRTAARNAGEQDGASDAEAYTAAYVTAAERTQAQFLQGGAGNAGTDYSDDAPYTLDDILLGPGQSNADNRTSPDEDAGGGGGGGGRSPLVDALAPSDEDIEAMREQFLSAEEMVRERYEEQLRMLDAYYEQTEGRAEEHAQRRAEIEAQMQQELQQIRMQGIAAALGSTSEMFSSLAQIAGQGGEEMLRVSKILSAAQAFVSTLAGAAEALRLPFPANLAAAAQVIATGAGFVAAIKGASPGGSNDPRSAGRGGAAAAGGGQQVLEDINAAPQRPNVELTLIGDQGFSRSQIVQIAEALNDSTDEGQLVEIRGRR